jgi:Protein kinase domain
MAFLKNASRLRGTSKRANAQTRKTDAWSGILVRSGYAEAVDAMSGAKLHMLGDYLLGAEIASGGMATVYLGRKATQVGCGSVVAIKRLHPHLARDPRFTATLVDEARLANRVVHPNVVRTRELVRDLGEAFLVMDHVVGESLANLWEAQRQCGVPTPLAITRTILVGVLRGLAAAHRASDENDELLNLVHRDISPQNVLVGDDGEAHVVDFGIARATGRLQATTEEGHIKGKIAYMAPEQVLDLSITARTDLYAVGVLLWEMVTGRRLYELDDKSKVLFLVAQGAVRSPRSICAVSDVLEQTILRALARDPADRFESADAMAEALIETGPLADTNEVSRWARRLAGTALAERMALVAELERADAALAARVDPAPLFQECREYSQPGQTRTETLEVTKRSGVRRPRQIAGAIVLACLVVVAVATFATYAPISSRASVERNQENRMVYTSRLPEPPRALQTGPLARPAGSAETPTVLPIFPARRDVPNAHPSKARARSKSELYDRY